MRSTSKRTKTNQKKQTQLDLCQQEVEELRVALATLAASAEQHAHEQEKVAQERVQELEMLNHALQQHDRLLEMTAIAANFLLTATSLDAAINHALRMIGEAVDTDRINIIETVAPASDSVFPEWRMLQYEWNSPGTVPQFRNPAAAQGSYEEIPAIFEHLHQGQAISYRIEDIPEPFRSRQMAVGVKATHLVPIFVKGQWWGVLRLNDYREAKQRSAAELSVLKIAANSIGSAIERERTQQAVLRAEQECTRSATKHSQELERHNAELRQTLDRLAESEAHYRALFELSSEGIYRWELDQPISVTSPVEEQVEQIRRSLYVVEANAAYAAMYGLPTTEAVSGSHLSDTHISTSDKNLEFLRRCIENSYRIRVVESEEVNPEGKRCYFLNNVIGIIEDGHLIGGWGTQLDISELRETQQALLEAEQKRSQELAKVNEELQKREHEVQQSYRLLSVVAQVTKDLLEAEDVEVAIPAALQAVGESANMSRVLLHIQRPDPMTQRLSHCIAYEWTAEGINDHRSVGLDVMDNEDYQALIQPMYNGQSVWRVIDDLPDATQRQFKKLDIQSTGVIPVFIEGRYIGCVAFDDCITPRQWNQQEIDVLTTAAESIGAALHRKQLVDRLVEERTKAAQERATELAKANEALRRSLDSLALEPSLDKFLGQVLTAIAEQLQSPQVEYWYHPTETCFHIGLMVRQGVIYSRSKIAQIHPDHPGIVGASVPQETQDQPIYQYKQYFIRDHAERYALGLCQELSLPLILGEMNIGMLVIRLPRSYQLTNQQIELAQALAHQATLAVRLTQLTEEAKQAAIAREQEKAAQERAAELAKANEVLARTSSHLAEQPNLSGFLGHIMLEAVAQMGAHGGHLTTYDPQQEIISTVVLVEQGKVISSLDFPPNMPISEVGFIQLIRETRQLRYFDLEANFEQDAQLLWQDVREHHKRRNHVVGIAIPLFIRDKFLGHFGLAFTNKKVVDEQNLELLQALANQAALAIQLTRLAEEAKQAVVLEERNRLARDIHDTLAQVLTGVILQLQAAETLHSAEVYERQVYLTQARLLAQQGLTEARRSVQALRPQVLEQTDLAGALSTLLQQMTAGTALQSRFRVHGDVYPISADMETQLLRIGQEALTNLVKHANANEALVELVYQPGQVQLRVQDDGCGFVQGRSEGGKVKGEGYGLVGMQERSQQIGATLSIASQPGVGTTIQVNLLTQSLESSEDVQEVRVLIADDHAIVLQGLAALIERQTGITVVAQAQNGREAIDMFRTHQPDVALLDLRMPVIDGVEAIALIRQECPTAKIIILTTYDTDEDIYRGLQAGAMAYLLKGSSDSLPDVIRAVHAGERRIPPEVAAKLANRMTRHELTNRELEVLRLIVLGQSNKEIGNSLQVSEGTVRAHINNILSKLGVRDRTQAATLAIKQGLVRLA